MHRYQHGVRKVVLWDACTKDPSGYREEHGYDFNWMFTIYGPILSARQFCITGVSGKLSDLTFFCEAGSKEQALEQLVVSISGSVWGEDSFKLLRFEKETVALVDSDYNGDGSDFDMGIPRFGWVLDVREVPENGLILS